MWYTRMVLSFSETAIWATIKFKNKFYTYSFYIGGLMFEREELLIGKENLKKINKTKVAVIGLGGVGGYATEALIRSGIENIIIVDYDKIDITNLNRQIIATKNNIDKFKTDETEKRILSINNIVKITKITKKLTPDNLDELFNLDFDYLIDCCDTIEVKQELIKCCLDRNITFISSMAMGNKINLESLTISDIRKTSYDKIAKKIRLYLRKNNIKGKIPVVWSKEQNKSFTGKIPSMVFTPAYSGLLCANYIIKEIIK